jgi:hypothetical protein
LANLRHTGSDHRGKIVQNGATPTTAGAAHLFHEVGQNYTQPLTICRDYNHLAFWQITCNYDQHHLEVRHGRTQAKGLA